MIIDFFLLLLFNILKMKSPMEDSKILNSVIMKPSNDTNSTDNNGVMKPSNNTNSTDNNGVQSSHWEAMALWLPLNSVQWEPSQHKSNIFTII